MPLRPVTWLNQITVNPTTDGRQGGASITQLANGNILVSWASDSQAGPGSPSGTDVLGRIFNPLGEPVTGEFRLNEASTAFDEGQASVAALPSGGFVVTYRVIKGGSYSDLRIEEYDASGQQVSEASLIQGDSSGAPPNYGGPHIAVGPTGEVLVTWLKQNEDGTIGIDGRFYDPATNAASAVFAVAADRAEESPAVAALAGSGFVVASVSATNGGVTYNLVAADGTVGPSTTIGSTGSDGRENEDPSVAALAEGGFVVTWTGTGADRTPRTFFQGVTPGGEFSGTAGPADDPLVTGLPDGGFVIVHDDMGADAMEAHRYAADGTVMGVHDFASWGFNGGVVALGDGRLAVAWQTSNDAAMEILDVRDAVGGSAYAPVGWQVGTVGADVFTSASRARVVASWRGDDVVTEGGGLATSFRLDQGNDRMVVTSGLDGDAFQGGSGIDRIDWSASSASKVVFDLERGRASRDGRTEGMTGFEDLVGTRNRDTIAGTEGANSLHGQAGDDLVLGRGGADKLWGGSGNDTLDGGTGSDRLEGGAGNDTYVLAVKGDAVVEAAGGGTDQIKAAVTVTLAAQVENLVLTGIAAIGGTGNALANRITGNAGANSLSGGDGNDVIAGRRGADALTGGGGADNFVFASVADSGLRSQRDSITDFAKGKDDLMLTTIDANAGRDGNQAFTLDAGGAFSAGEVRQMRSGSDLLIELNTDSDAAAEMTILLRGVTGALAASDFLL